MPNETEGASEPMNNMRFTEQESFIKVDRIEPKRCYVTSQTIGKLSKGNERYLRQLSREEFQERLEEAKKIVLKLSEEELDASIASENYPKRLKAYNSVEWYQGVVYADEVGVWKGAGGLPLEWTQGSLAETADKVAQALKDQKNKDLAARAKRAIPRMSENIDIIEQEPYLYPIVLPGATEGRGKKGEPYKGFKLMKGDIDDGCMRSLTLIVNGRSTLQAYIGIRNK